MDDLQQHNFTQPKTIDSIRLFLKNDYEDFVKEYGIHEVDFNVHGAKLEEFEVDDDEKFHEVLYEKCKLIILLT